MTRAEMSALLRKGEKALERKAREYEAMQPVAGDHNSAVPQALREMAEVFAEMRKGNHR